MIASEGRGKGAGQFPEAQASPLVSIVIPAFNAERFLEETLATVAEQTYRPLQVLVVDDGSTDRTVGIVKAWLQNVTGEEGLEGKVLEQVHQGGSAARNLGVASSLGRWIQFLDADDLLAPGKIAAQLAALSGSSSTIAYCGWRIRRHLGATIQESALQQGTPIPDGSDVLAMHLEGWYCPQHCYLWPRDLVAGLGGFDASLGADQDGDLMLRALASGAQLRYVPGVEVQYRAHSSGQVSRIRSRSKLRSRFRVARKIAATIERRAQIEPYRKSLAIRFDELRRTCCVTYPALAELCRRASEAYWPGHSPAVQGGTAYRISRKLLGLYAAEWLSLQKRKLFRRGDT